MSACDLRGLCILNTRPRAQADALNRLVLAAQGKVINFPVLDIQACDKAWIDRLPNLADIDQAIFISSNAVTHSFDEFSRQAVHWPESIYVTAIGKSTAQALQQRLVRVNAVPIQSDSEHLLKLPSFQQIENQIIVLFKGEGGRPLIASTLRERGARLFESSVYRRRMPPTDPKGLNAWWQDDAVDIILITCQDALHNLFAMTSHRGISRLQSIPCLVISARLADSATRLGMKTVLVSQVDTLLETLHQFNKGLHHGQ